MANRVADNPKQIYYCDWPDCHRSFVRQDLCARHKERHSAGRNGQLLRKDTSLLMHSLNPIVTAALANQAKTGEPGSATSKHTPVSQQERAHPQPTAGPGHPGQMSPPSMPSSALSNPRQDISRRSSSCGSRGSNDVKFEAQPHGQGGGAFAPPPRLGAPYGSSFGSARAPLHSSPQPNGSGAFQRPELRAQTSNLSSYGNASPYTATTPSQSHPPSANSSSYPQSAGNNYQSQQTLASFTSLPPPEYPQQSIATSRSRDGQYYNGVHGQAPTNGMQPTAQTDTPMNDTPDPILDGSSYAIPVFGGEGISRSPFAMADDFTAWLFNDSSNINGPGASPMGYAPGSAGQFPGAGSQMGLQTPFFNYDPTVSGYYQNPVPPSQHTMSVNSILDMVPESALSEEKRKDLIHLIQVRFNETEHIPVEKQKEELLDGNREDDHHVLSLHMMQTYISSYWVHVHPQLPILHKPTFSATQCPDLLLLAIMCLGAACLEKSYGHDMTTACSALSNFLAWHLRWEIFMDADFRPPAKLWVFQALLLLEVFEKMYSTRPLHERAHIHHATTLTLMRRGSSLIGRSAMDSPPSVKGGGGGGGSHSAVNTPDAWWKRWIHNEATKRAAFAAFVMDSIHATMFGHSAVMVAHEMRLPLPCDESLWSATSSAEVGRIEQAAHASGLKHTGFLDGLKKTLNGQPVKTNSFGRTILMAGLLSVSWHMNQRDLQVSSLGVSQVLGGRDKWRGSLTRAFDFWKQDYDKSLPRSRDSSLSGTFTNAHGVVVDNDYESRTVLHHLAHMAMHVDIVDCQIYAGAQRLLGRSITAQDYNLAQKRMKEHWAPTARARDATFYALRFLSDVLIPDECHESDTIPTSLTYSARDDVLLNRPWVLYFATLIVWSYGYALDGPVMKDYQLPSYEDKIRDMYLYLRRVGGVRAPDDLQATEDRNACLGMLIIMRDMFKKTRWELLHEASTLLTKCIDMLVPGAGAM